MVVSEGSNSAIRAALSVENFSKSHIISIKSWTFYYHNALAILNWTSDKTDFPHKSLVGLNSKYFNVHIKSATCICFESKLL